MSVSLGKLLRIVITAVVAIGLAIPLASSALGATGGLSSIRSSLSVFGSSNARISPPNSGQPVRFTILPSETATETATSTEEIPTATATNTATATEIVPTATSTNTATATEVIPTATATNTATATEIVPTATSTNTATATEIVPTSTATSTASATSAVTGTATATVTGTSVTTETATATNTATLVSVTETATVAPSETPILVDATETSTVVPTATEDDTLGGVTEEPVDPTSTSDADGGDPGVTDLPVTGGGPDDGSQRGLSWLLVAVLVLFAGVAGKVGTAYARAGNTHRRR